MSYYTGIFLVGAHWFGVPLPKLPTFSGILWFSSTYWLQSIRKNGNRNFCLFFYFQTYNGKSKFSFLHTVQSRSGTSYLRTSHFSVKCRWYRFLALIFLYTLKKILKILEMELKTYTLVGPKFVVEKIKYTNLEIQFRPLKCTVVTRIRKTFEQPFIPIQAIQGSYSVLK